MQRLTLALNCVRQPTALFSSTTLRCWRGRNFLTSRWTCFKNSFRVKSSMFVVKNKCLSP